MKNLILFALILFSCNAVAQNYNCFQPAAKNYFINGNGYVRGIRIDSSKTSGTDVIYYPYKTQRISNYLAPTDLNSFLGGSWLGGKVIRHSDGTYLFDNLWDTVIIKTQAPIGASWPFYNDTSHFNYTATITAIDTMTIMGTLDSVKKITIYCDSFVFSYPGDPVNYFQIWLSKNHGFVQVFDLYTFPYHRPDTLLFIPPHTSHNIRFIDYYLDVVLSNLGTCDLGCADNAPDTVNSIFRLFDFYNPTKKQIFNFAVGDVYESHLAATSITTPYFLQTYTLDSIFTATTIAATSVYTGSEHAMTINLATTYPATTWDTTYTTGTYANTADTTPLVSKLTMPEESTAGYLLHYFPKNVPFSGLCDTPAAYVIDQDYKATGFGYDGTAYRASNASNTYSIGYGITGKSSFNATTGIQQQQGYSFYKKGMDTCGSFTSTLRPYNVGVSNLTSINCITISPNPASVFLNISSVSGISAIVISNLLGQIVFANDFNTNQAQINVSDLEPGIYILKINNSEVRKFVKL